MPRGLPGAAAGAAAAGCLPPDAAAADADDAALRALGIKPSLPRTWSYLDNILTSVAALYFIGGVTTLLQTALATGGSLPTWVNWIVSSAFTLLIAASLAEVCSKWPTAGSIYFWAFKCGGAAHGPLLAWLTAATNAAGWTMNVAADALAGANTLLTIPVALGHAAFPSDPDDPAFRAIQFATAAAFLAAAAALNLLPHRVLGHVIQATGVLMAVLYLLHVAWLPAAVARGGDGLAGGAAFNAASAVFGGTANGNGAPSDGYNWAINILFPMYALVGFDASGHVAEETKASSAASPAGVFGSALWSAVFAFPLVLVLLFCAPPGGAPESYAQPVLFLYQSAFGSGGMVFMAALSALLFLLNTAATLLAASRLFFAIARDGIFPAALARLDARGQPAGAVAAVSAAALALLLTILPSAVAYASITSGSVICILLSYLFVLCGRLALCVERFGEQPWSLGRASRGVAAAAAAWCGYCVVVLSLPQTFPVEAATFNYAPFVALLVLLVALGTWGASGRTWFKGPGQGGKVAAAPALPADSSQLSPSC